MSAHLNQRRIKAAENAVLHVDAHATNGPLQPAGNGEVDIEGEKFGINGAFHFDNTSVGGLDRLDIRDHIEPLFDPIDALGVDVGTHFDARQLLSELSNDLNDILATVSGSIGENGWFDWLDEMLGVETDEFDTDEFDNDGEDSKDFWDNLKEGWDRFWDDDNALGTKSDNDGDVSNSPQGADCKANESDCNSDNDSTDASENSGTAITAESEGPWGRGPLGPIFFQSGDESPTRNGRDMDVLSAGGASTFNADALVQQVNGTIGYEMQPVDFANNQVSFETGLPVEGIGSSNPMGIEPDQMVGVISRGDMFAAANELRSDNRF